MFAVVAGAAGADVGPFDAPVGWAFWQLAMAAAAPTVNAANISRLIESRKDYLRMSRSPASPAGDSLFPGTKPTSPGDTC